MSDAASPEADSRDIRPIVPTGRDGNWGMWAFLVVLALGGLFLFNALSASREASQAPSVLAPADASAGRIASPTPLGVPDRFLQTAPELQAKPPQTESIEARATRQIAPPVAQAVPQPIPSFEPAPLPALPPPAPRVVFENLAQTVAPANVNQAEGASERVTADRFRNPSLTIPQGTVIPAVLETALDSTRPGGVRALVQRDVSGFDGARVLVPRGSRLYGQYESSLQAGQKRAMVQWTRLIRPDGVTIALDSPSSDPLGRAGIKGKVDSKFLQRFGGAILQSVLDIGVGLAVNEATDGVIVALPGSTQNVRVAEPQQIQPTLKVKHGTSVSVFVARDLDFSSVDR